MPIEEFKRYLIDRFCDSERMLTAAEIARIEEIEQTYLDESFFKGSNPAYTVTKSEKIAGVGEVAVGLEMRSGIIHRISLSGDYFMLSDPMPALNSLLRGKRIDEAAEALKGIDMGRHIANLTTTQLTEIILKS